jgi:hypothetical protein
MYKKYVIMLGFCYENDRTAEQLKADGGVRGHIDIYVLYMVHLLNAE